MATFLKKVHKSLDEAVTAVTKIYNKDTQYNYNNDKIASLLYFTDMDYAQSYCCYNDSKRLERKREANRRAKDIAIIFDVSTRTIQRIKKELRKE